MIVPKFWAEAVLKTREKKRQVTVRRFGWSDVGQAEAQALADGRAREALARLEAGEPIERREPKAAYNGAEGVPIREEIVSRHGEAVVTRNSYGARCLNTPNVLFADIDFPIGPSAGLIRAMIKIMVIGAVALGWWMRSVWVGIGAGVVGFITVYVIAHLLLRLRTTLAGGNENRARRRVEKFLAAHPDWSMRLYRTPAGLRVLAMHRTFDPREPEVAECFRALRVDPVYARMCTNQNCFRARVSPKPWRIGIGAHLRPRPGVWPVDPERLPAREQWIEAYERAARGFASCRFLEALGSGGVNPTARAVQTVHDEMCQAGGSLPIA